MIVWSGWAGAAEEVPAGGFVVDVTFVVADRSYTLWFATEPEARKCLAELQVEHGGRWASANELDFTAEGCFYSGAEIRHRR